MADKNFEGSLESLLVITSMDKSLIESAGILISDKSAQNCERLLHALTPKLAVDCI